ncbi:MAG: tRNA (guanosine(37)-N1)-methyltransferase TrmD [Deltaproteobacteria bacterium]|nr:tRNA (guanosine(37)-N1)-methyltransferase TrmD [Deltaproteobacteria bacterium]
MFNYQFITIFPELIEQFIKAGLISRARSSGLIDISCINLRDFAINTHGQVDDSPYGGGSGMVLRVEPAFAAIDNARQKSPQAKVLSFTPRGQVFNQGMAHRLLQEANENNAGFILLCNRYEGVDERVVQQRVDYEINMGDYIMMGGETPALAFLEATSRLIPGVLGNADSIAEESFENNLLEYPQYTKPAEFQGLKVPEVLLSGNHAEIKKWREDKSLADTLEKRPDLAAKADYLRSKTPRIDTTKISLALIHYPVLDKQGDIITSSVTNIDLHDIARSCRTYDIDKLYIVHPTKILRRLSEKICDHWEFGYGLKYNPNRSEALSLIKVCPELQDVLLDIKERHGRLPKIVTTSARSTSDTISYVDFRGILATTTVPHLILFGTGWGLADEVMSLSDYRLDPIYGCSHYNHLSVRSAAAIILDRLLGSFAPNNQTKESI